jgi:hypothetical protein
LKLSNFRQISVIHSRDDGRVEPERSGGFGNPLGSLEPNAQTGTASQGSRPTTRQGLDPQGLGPCLFFAAETLETTMSTNATEVNLVNETILEAKARRIAKRHDHRVCKARGRLHMNNRGQFQLINWNNNVVGGSDFDMTPQEIIDYFVDLEAKQ